jgi:hypothetical protein
MAKCPSSFCLVYACFGVALGIVVSPFDTLVHWQKPQGAANRHCAKRTRATTSSKNSDAKLVVRDCHAKHKPVRTMVKAGMSEVLTFCMCTKAALTDFYLLVCDSSALVGKYIWCVCLTL